MSSDPSLPPAAAHTSAPVGLIALLTGIVLVGILSTSLYIPSLPSLATALDADPSAVKLTMTAFLIAFAVAQLIYGPASDRFGRRPVLITGLIIYLIGTTACAFAPTIEALIVGRVIQGFGACAGNAIPRAVVRDRFDPPEGARVIAFLSMAVAIGPAAGPIMGGFLEVWFGWRAGFFFLTALSGTILIVVWFSLVESLRQVNPHATAPSHIVRNYALLLGDRSYVGHMLVVGFLFWGVFAYSTGLPFVMIDLLGVPPARFGFVFVFTVAGMLIGSAIAARISRRVGGNRMMAIGSLMLFAGGAAMLALAATGRVSIPAIVLPMALYMLGFGIALPNAISGAMAPFPAVAGAAAALMGFVQMVLAALGSAFVAGFYNGTAVPMAAGVCIAGILGLASWIVFVRPRRA
ncbi:MAG: multidrug effflux MFS transporter [Rhodospirillales bacterium]|nr:multidrug effflux MFS transporter [Rhodospirillales bacterium]